LVIAFYTGYNNYDISYTAGTLLTYTVTLYETSNATTVSYLTGSTVTVNVGSRDGYVFAGWIVYKGGVSLSDRSTATFTMPSNNVALAATWTLISSGDKGQNGSSPNPSPSEPVPSIPAPSSSNITVDKDVAWAISGIMLLAVLAAVVLVIVVIAVVVLLLRKESKA